MTDSVQEKKSTNTIRSLINKLRQSKIQHNQTLISDKCNSILFDEPYIRDTFACLLGIFAHLPTLKAENMRRVMLDELKNIVDIRLFETLRTVFLDAEIRFQKDKSHRDLIDSLIAHIRNGIDIATLVIQNNPNPSEKLAFNFKQPQDLPIYLTKVDLIAREEIANFKTENQEFLHRLGRWMGRGYAIASGMTIFYSVFLTGSWAWIFLAVPLALVNYHVNWENLAKSIVSKMTIDLFGGERWYHFEGLRSYYCDDANDTENYGKRVRLSRFKQSLMFVALALSVAAGFALAALGFSCITGIVSLKLFHGALIGGVWGKSVAIGATFLATLLSATVFYTESALILFGMNKLLKNSNPIKASIQYFKKLLGSNAERNAHKSMPARILDSIIIISAFTFGSALCVIALFFSMHVSIAPLAAIFVAWGMGASSAATLSAITCMWIAFSAQIPFALVTAAKFTKRFAVQFSDWLCNKIFTPRGYQALNQENMDTEINFNQWLQTKLHQEKYFGITSWQKFKLRSQYYAETIINAVANVFIVIKNIFMTIVGLSGRANSGNLAMVGLLASGTFVNSAFSCSLDIPDNEPDPDSTRNSYRTILAMKSRYSMESDIDSLTSPRANLNSGDAIASLGEHYNSLYQQSAFVCRTTNDPNTVVVLSQGRSAL